MGKETVEALVDGGKATAAPPLGSSLGPLKVNMGQIISQINEKTKVFSGMKVPVKIIVDTDTKDFSIEIGTPPTSQLIKKEVKLETGSGEPNKLKVGVLAFEQIIKIAKMKEDAILANNFKSAVKVVIGVCGSMGILIENKDFKEIMKEVNEGKYDSLIQKQATEIPINKKTEYEAINKELQNKQKEAAKKKEEEKAAVAAEQAKTATAGATPTAAAPTAGAAPAEKKKESKK